MNDIDALTLALEAYQDSVIRKGSEHSLPGIPLNNEQLFFVSFAQVSIIREAISIISQFIKFEFLLPLMHEDKI